MDIPSAWSQIDYRSLNGVVLLVGATDVGKTTLAHHLFREIAALSLDRPVGFIDGDPGQSLLGPPGTMTLAFDLPPAGSFSFANPIYRYFIGAVTPRGHMLNMLVSSKRLADAAWEARASTLVYDTSGFIEPSLGGLALKLAKIDLLRPQAIFSIQRQDELEPLLAPLRRAKRQVLFELEPSPAARRRGQPDRRLHRQRQFQAYFRTARPLELEWRRLAVFPQARFALNRLVALEDIHGYTLSLGIILSIDRQGRRITLLTPIDSLEKVNALRLGDISIDPVTFTQAEMA